MKALLKPKDVCERLGISPSQLCRMSRRGSIPAINLSDSPKNKTFRYDEQELEQWLREKRQPTRRAEPPRHRKRSHTPVIRSANSSSEPCGNKNETCNTQGTEHPLSAQ